MTLQSARACLADLLTRPAPDLALCADLAADLGMASLAAWLRARALIVTGKANMKK